MTAGCDLFAYFPQENRNSKLRPCSTDLMSTFSVDVIISLVTELYMSLKSWSCYVGLAYLDT